MPRYDYECKKCEYQQEVFQNFSEEPLTKCPACKKKQFRRVISPDALCIQLKPTIKDVKTVGQLAEQNSKKLGKYGVEDRDRERKAKSKVLRNKMNPVDPLFDGPLRDPKVRNKVLKTKKTTKEYVLNGKIPT